VKSLPLPVAAQWPDVYAINTHSLRSPGIAQCSRLFFTQRRQLVISRTTERRLAVPNHD
jgi:hypothetical protein